MDVLSELLECSVCLNTLDISSKVLPCQHTFCKKCLQEIVDSRKELRCPECRVLVTVPVDDLPPNVLLTRILEGMKNAANQAPPPSHNNAHSSGSKEGTNNTGVINQMTVQVASVGISERISNDGASTIPEISNSPQHQVHAKPKAPHAKAIYDFNSKESGDLSFKKGDIILLKKRIDQNWYIGELSGKTGSFPVNHVHVIVPLPIAQCKALYDFKMKPNEEEGCLAFKKGTIINVLRRVDHNWAEGRIDDAIGIFPISFVEMNSMAKQLMEISAKNMQISTSARTVPMPPFETNFNNSDSSSTTTTSPNSTPSNTSSSNSSTAPNSPINSNDHENSAAVPVRSGPNTANAREKRNSLTALINTSGPLLASNRHSAEILSVPELEPVGASNVKPAVIQRPERGHTRSKSGHHHPHQTHLQTYVALYPYKPQKPDELELKKGSVYYVLEKCQDGWFKGVNAKQKSGVFPGNYVAPIRRDLQPGNSNNHNQKQQIFISQANYQKTLQNPPDLPPRNNEQASASTTNALSTWSKSLHNSYMDSLFNRKTSQQLPQHLNTSGDQTATVETQTGVGSISTGTESQKPSGKEKEKKDSSAISFVKRLTKRSKSPASSSLTPSYSMDNPVFEDSSVPTVSNSSSSRVNINLSHPVHVRSGSCPSQLLQNIPIDAANPTGQGPFVYGSQRIKGHKERPSMAHLRNNADLTISAANNRIRNAQAAAASQQQPMMSMSANQQQLSHSVGAQSTHQHRKSQSLDATTLSAQLASDANTSSSTAVKSKNSGYARERFRCIVPYPPNSEYELELRVGDIVFVSKKRENGWYKGQHQRTGKIGLFPASFVQPDF